MKGLNIHKKDIIQANTSNRERVLYDRINVKNLIKGTKNRERFFIFVMDLKATRFAFNTKNQRREFIKHSIIFKEVVRYRLAKKTDKGIEFETNIILNDNN